MEMSHSKTTKDYISMELEGCISSNEELINKYREGDLEVKNKIILKNMGLIHAFIYQNRWLYEDSNALTEEDFIQEGVIALYDAIEKFDGERGASFSSYAFLMLKANLYRVHYDKSKSIRIPSYRYEEYQKFRTKEKKTIQALGYYPKTGELSRVTGYSVEEILDFRNDFQKITSLNTTLDNEDDSGELGDLLEDSYNHFEAVEKDMYLKQLNKDLEDAMDLLKDGHKDILCDVIGWKRKPLTQASTAIKNDISTSRVQQITQQALRRIRKLKTKYLMEKYNELIGYELQKFDSSALDSATYIRLFRNYIKYTYNHGDIIIINNTEGTIDDFTSAQYFGFNFMNESGTERYVYIEYKNIVDYQILPGRKILLKASQIL